jgi:hypothetical protein
MALRWAIRANSRLETIMRSPLLRRYLLLLGGLFLAACSTMATYDQTAYEKATAAKAEALALMDMATGSFSAHEKEIESVEEKFHLSFQIVPKSMDRRSAELTFRQGSTHFDLYPGPCQPPEHS